VNKKLHDVYSDLDKDTRIHVLNLTHKYGPNSFYTVNKDGKNPNTNQQPNVATTPLVTPPKVVLPPKPTVVQPVVAPPNVVVTPKSPVEEPVVTTPNAVVNPKSPVVQPVVTRPSPKPPVVEPVPSPEVLVTPKSPTVENQPVVTPVVQNQNVQVPAINTPRRLDVSVMFLPNKELTQEIAKVLLNALDWGFRAQTSHPTPAVTKPPDYYGYEWCMQNYEDSVCFEYYYGYTWCLEKFDDDECYSYYYGDITEWGKNESYKWCLNFYDEEYCEFAYLDEKPDTWDWLSFGYHDCLKNHSVEDCSELYYSNGDSEKINTVVSDVADELDYSAGNVMLSLLISIALFGCLSWVTWKKFNCCKPKINCCKPKYNRLDPGDEGGEDEVELL